MLYTISRIDFISRQIMLVLNLLHILDLIKYKCSLPWIRTNFNVFLIILLKLLNTSRKKMFFGKPCTIASSILGRSDVTNFLFLYSMLIGPSPQNLYCSIFAQFFSRWICHLPGGAQLELTLLQARDQTKANINVPRRCDQLSHCSTCKDSGQNSCSELNF